MFELTDEDNFLLMSQDATSKEGHGGSHYSPMVFIEHGVIQLFNAIDHNNG